MALEVMNQFRGAPIRETHIREVRIASQSCAVTVVEQFNRLGFRSQQEQLPKFFVCALRHMLKRSVFNRGG